MYMQSTSYEMPGWMTHKLESRLLGEIPTTSDMQMRTTLIVESKEELKSLLLRVIEESEKLGLKLSIQKTKIMASDLINSWQIEREKVETVTDFIYLFFNTLTWQFIKKFRLSQFVAAFWHSYFAS